MHQTASVEVVCSKRNQNFSKLLHSSSFVQVIWAPKFQKLPKENRLNLQLKTSLTFKENNSQALLQKFWLWRKYFHLHFKPLCVYNNTIELCLFTPTAMPSSNRFHHGQILLSKCGRGTCQNCPWIQQSSSKTSEFLQSLEK